MNEVTNSFTLPDWLPFVILFLALVISGASFWVTRRQKKFDLFLSLWKEYTSHEMLDGLMAVYKLWSDNRGSDAEIIAEYVRRVRDEGDIDLHDKRRRVSLFYQIVAFSYFKNLLPRKLKRVWTGFSLGAIAVLKPIETEAIPQIFENQSEFPQTLTLTKEIVSKDFRRMFKLYNTINSKKRPPSDFEKWIQVLSQSIP